MGLFNLYILIVKFILNAYKTEVRKTISGIVPVQGMN